MCGGNANSPWTPRKALERAKIDACLLQTWGVVASKVPDHQQRGFHPVQLRGPGRHHGNRGVSSNMSAKG